MTDNGKGFVHIYEGDGKGKTTAATGLAVRHAGRGGRVLFTQFLKGNDSGEIGVLKTVPGMTVLENTREFGFTFAMNEEQRAEARAYFTEHFRDAVLQARQGNATLLVMDELIDACNAGMVDSSEVVRFLHERPDGLEVVLTGRNPSDDLKDCADYYTHMGKVKHPFDNGLRAREGIEW